MSAAWETFRRSALYGCDAATVDVARLAFEAGAAVARQAQPHAAAYTGGGPGHPEMPVIARRSRDGTEVGTLLPTVNGRGLGAALAALARAGMPVTPNAAALLVGDRARSVGEVPPFAAWQYVSRGNVLDVYHYGSLVETHGLGV